MALEDYGVMVFPGPKEPGLYGVFWRRMVTPGEAILSSG